ERLAAQQLHGQVVLLSVAAEMKHTHDIRMCERLRTTAFALQSNMRIRVVAYGRADQLEGDVGIRIMSFLHETISGSEYLTHASATQASLKDVALINDERLGSFLGRVIGRCRRGRAKQSALSEHPVRTFPISQWPLPAHRGSRVNGHTTWK